MRVVTWKVKVTLQCPLRCRYCYEYGRLGSAGAMPLQHWRSLFTEMRQRHAADPSLPSLVLLQPDGALTSRRETNLWSEAVRAGALWHDRVPSSAICPSN